MRKKRKKKQPFRGRFYLLAVFYYGFFLLLGLRLFYLQLWQHRFYLALAENQHWRREILPAQRGRILSHDYYPLADNLTTYRLFLILPQFSLSEAKEKTLLSSGVELKQFSPWQELKNFLLQEKVWSEEEGEKMEEQLQKILAGGRIQWLLIAREVGEESREKLEKMFRGIYLQPEANRLYPEGKLAAQVLGFLGENEEGEAQGYFGLEGFYNGDLQGQEGWRFWEKDALGNPIPLGIYRLQPPRDGRDLVLTIDRNLQYLLEEKLNAGVEKYGAKSGTFVLLDPTSGAVLAMASVPSFLPSQWREEEEENLVNRAIGQTYEPGSVLKVLTMGAALEEKVVEPQTRCPCQGPLTIQGHTIRTWNDRYYPQETMAEILQHSDNVGAAWVARKLGLSRYLKYLQRAGLGEKTGIDLEGEEAGIVKPAEDWQEIDLATAAFGQGISVTPLQLSLIFAAVANGGLKPQPYVVEKLIDNGREIKLSHRPPQRLFSEKTSAILRQMLRDVIRKGEFKWFVRQAGLENFPLAGKTGTAQIPRAGGYDPRKTNVTFVGFAPLKQPRFVLLVKLEEPTASIYSAETAAPLWLEMVKELILYFNLTPE